MKRLQTKTARLIAQTFESLDYQKLGTIYCDEGGEAFWEDRREPCRTLGIVLAEVLLNRLKSGGRSLYVGAGVAEIPMLFMEALDLERHIDAFNLRVAEVAVLNQACKGLPLPISANDARSARGSYDHLWIVSVLNDPEQYQNVSALCYGRANPVTFNPHAFLEERTHIMAVAEACLKKVALPGLVSTSVEEIPWITDWCDRNRIRYVVEDEDYPTAIVEDPVCLIRIEGDDPKEKR